MPSTSRGAIPIWMLFGRGLCLADRAAVDHFLLQPYEPVPVRLLDADGTESDRHDARREAVFASSLRDFGAIFAVLYLGLAIDRIGPERALALHYAAGAVFIAVIALVALPYAFLWS